MKSIFKLALLAAIAASALAAHAADIAILQNGFEIRHEKRKALGAKTRLYLSTDPAAGYVDIATDQITRYEHDDSVQVQPVAAAPEMQPKPVDIDAAVEHASKTHAIDADLINSVIHAESRFNPKALSPKGAQGLMQLMPETASQLGVQNAFDPHANVDGGTRYLRELLLRYNDDLIKALAAYNAGPQRVDQFHGVPPYRETRLYVANIIRDFNKKKLAQQQVSPQAGQKSKSVAKVTRNTATKHHTQAAPSTRKAADAASSTAAGQ